jgi:hypothetical protein
MESLKIVSTHLLHNINVKCGIPGCTCNDCNCGATCMRNNHKQQNARIRFRNRINTTNHGHEYLIGGV